MQTALLPMGITFIFVGLAYLFGERTSGFENVTLYFVVATWINVIKK